MLRTVISSLYCTSSDDSMVVQAYVLLDPNKENLYFRQELLPKIETKTFSRNVVKNQQSIPDILSYQHNTVVL